MLVLGCSCRGVAQVSECIAAGAAAVVFASPTGPRVAPGSSRVPGDGKPDSMFVPVLRSSPIPAVWYVMRHASCVMRGVMTGLFVVSCDVLPLMSQLSTGQRGASGVSRVRRHVYDDARGAGAAVPRTTLHTAMESLYPHRGCLLMQGEGRCRVGVGACRDIHHRRPHIGRGASVSARPCGHTLVSRPHRAGVDVQGQTPQM